MFTKIHLKILYIFLLLIAYSIRANAHEFWIEPTQYQLNDDLINAHLRVGQEFQGMVLMYNPQDFKTFKILSGSKNKKEKINLLAAIFDEHSVNILSFHRLAKFKNFNQQKIIQALKKKFKLEKKLKFKKIELSNISFSISEKYL